MPPKTRSNASTEESDDDNHADDSHNKTMRESGDAGQGLSIEAKLQEMMQQIQNLRGELEKSNLRAAAAEQAGRASSSPGSNNSMSTENNDLLAAAISELSRTMSVSRVENPRKLYDLPVFDGTPEVWPMFKEAFNTTTEQYHYTERENMLRLQKALKGQAYEAVGCLLIHSSNVPQIMKFLGERFGRADQLVVSQIAKVRNAPSISDTNLEQIIPFATKVQNLASFLDAAGGTQHLANPTLMNELLRKLPAQRQIEWVRYSKSVEGEPTVKHFSEWLQELSSLVNTVCINFREHPRRVESRGGRANFFHADVVDSVERRCVVCSGEHEVGRCARFIAMTVKQRWRLVRQQRLCFNCLEGKHRSSSCRQKHTCDDRGCQKKLHRLLHFEERNTRHNNSGEQQQQQQQQRHVFTNSIVRPEAPSLLFKVLPVKLFANGKEVICHALFDEGSAITLINKSLADRLGLRGRKEKLKLQWFGGRTVMQESSTVSMEISGVEKNSQKFELNCVRTVKNLQLPTQSMNISELARKYRHLANLSILSYEAATPELLIGLDNAHLGATKQTVADGFEGPAVISTKLGWVVYGNGNSCNSDKNNHVFFARAYPEDGDLDQLVRNHLADEDLGVGIVENKIESYELTRSKDLLERTTVRLEERFETGLLWKHEDVVLPSSYEMTMKRYLSLEKKFQRDEDLRREYIKIMKDYLQKGFVRVLNREETLVRSSRTWYLPHFGIQNPNKPGKLRLVFDAAAEVEGTSLNSELLIGPDLGEPLAIILMKFRQKAIAVSGDIAQMFHQVKIRKEDQASQRFFWRDNIEDPIEEYAMTVMMFGAKCSPCSAQFVKNKNAKEFQAEYPEAVAAILNNHYVDDYVHCFSSESEAVRVTKQVIRIHAHGGFELRGFVSNSVIVEEKLNNSKAQHLVCSLDRCETECSQKVLGLHWDTRVDRLKFVLAFGRVDPDLLRGVRNPTKREVLRIMMSVFDPFGIAAEYSLIGKLLIQLTWRKQIEWDHVIPEEGIGMWKDWLDKLQEIRNLSVPRCYSAAFSSTPVELHIFTDASELAYATVAYWRIPEASQICLAFVLGKTKCAPLKLTSIPRLELQSAVLGARLRKTILSSHDIKPVRVVMWSDSKTVLSWIQSDHRNYKPYVAHRVNEILENTTVMDWRWLPSALNPADFGTRLKTKRRESFWVNGPNFLLEEEQNWPKTVLYGNTEEELRPKAIVLHASQPHELFERFSCFSRLRRIVALVLRFRDNSLSKMKKNVKIIGGLLPKEIERAELLIVRRVQMDSFLEEFQLLEKGEQVPKSSELWKLTPCLDETNTIRLNGRITRALAVPYNTRKPMILPKNNYVTELIVDFYHRLWKHQNHNTIINELRRKFWIPHIRRAVQRAAKRCRRCQREKAEPVFPQMGQLPEDRLTPYVRPFTYVGLDYMGPFMITIGRRSEKRWIAIFTCLTIRAIHLEIAKDLTTDTCLMCIRNFINRRGTPMRIRSDNATNFVGAQRELKRQELENDKIRDTLANQNIEWIFNCPLNPHAGGCWERLVRSVKRAMGHAVYDLTLQEHCLYSLMCEAENIVNSRPLTHIPLDDNFSEPITPNHFLLGTANSEQTPHPAEERFRASKKHWRIAQHMQRRFWKKWIAEYLPDLCRRTKWFQPVDPLSTDDVVLICDSSIHRSKWMIGRITQIFPGKDGQVRTAAVLTKSGVIKRPSCMLAKLDVGESLVS